MPTPVSPQSLLESDFRVGSHRVQPTLMTIVRPDGEGQRIHQKALQVLCHLAEHVGKPLTKRQILDAVWPDTHVGDEVLSNAIYELRRALGDDARKPWAIRTIHGRGYQLIAEVSWDRPSPSPSPSPSPTALPDRHEAPPPKPPPTVPTVSSVPSRLRRTVPWIVAALLALAVAVLWLAPRRFAPPHRDPGPRPIRLGELVNTSGAAELDSPTADLGRHLRSRIRKSPYLELAGEGAADPDDLLRVEGQLSQEGEEARFEVWIEEGAAGQDGQAHSPIIRRGPTQKLADLVETTCEEVLLELELTGCGIAEARQGVEASKAHSLAAWLHYRDGLEARRRNAYGDAIASLRQAVILDPEYAHAHDLLANVYDIVGHREQAEQAIERAIDTAEDWSETERLLLLRRRAQIAGRTSEELSLLRRILATDPHNAEWRFKLAWFYKTHERDCAKSAERYEDLPPDSPWSGHWLKYRSDHALSCGDPHQASDLLRQQVAAEPSADTYDQLAYALILTGEYEAAERSLDAARELDPESALTLLLRGKLALARGQLDTAEGAFEEYRAIFEWPSTEAEAYVHLARVHLARGADGAALEAANEAVERKPWSIEARGVRGLVELRVFGPGVAHATLEEIDRQRRETAAESRYEMEHYHYLAGAIALVEARWDDAVTAFRAAVELHPENRATFAFALARAWQLSGEDSRAEPALHQALEFNPRHAPSLCALAEIEPVTRDQDPSELLADQDCRRVLTPPFVDLGLELANRDESSRTARR